MTALGDDATVPKILLLLKSSRVGRGLSATCCCACRTQAFLYTVYVRIAYRGARYVATTARIRRDGAALPFTCATRSKLQPAQCTLKAQGSRAKPKGAPKCEKREGPTVRRKGLIYSRKVQGGMIHED